MKKLSHTDNQGKARMVDIASKPTTVREAVARGAVMMNKATMALIKKNQMAKGDVLGIARVAGIMAAKKTPQLIPLCHPLLIASVSVDFSFDTKKKALLIESRVMITGQTGVEMEALTAAAVAALTIYDMCKAVDKEMVISDIMLVGKTGGKSGTFRRS
jgi:cyclic pyranopterin phosphate synthase